MDLTVAIILDAKFGIKLKSISPETITWAYQSSENQMVAKGIWSDLAMSGDKRRDPLTLFNYDKKSSAEKNLFNILPEIESHHQWSVLDVYGAELTEEIRNVLTRDFAATGFQKTSFGFRITR